MVLESKQTTVAYRCPHCGAGIMSAVGLFALSADMVKLKCTCGNSEMTVVYSKDGKVRLTVPCLLCAKPHTYTLNSTLFFDKDLFSLQCPYTDMNIAFLGETNTVKAELARSELELLDLMEKSGLKNFDQFHDDEASLPDPQVLEIVMFVINDLDAEGKIFCKCAPEDNGRQYDAEILNDGVKVTCRKCGATRLIPTDSRLGAHAFLNADALYLE
jgi:DNA-directed RNA polymerase subunit RPC12/RpoP